MNTLSFFFVVAILASLSIPIQWLVDYPAFYSYSYPEPQGFKEYTAKPHEAYYTINMMKAKFTKSELVYLLVLTDKENSSVAPGAYWPRFYAKFIISRYL